MYNRKYSVQDNAPVGVKRLEYTDRQKPSLERWDEIRPELFGELIEAGMSEEDTVSFLVAAEEMYVNIVRHGYPQGIGDDSFCETGLSVFEDAEGKYAVITFKDDGMAFNPLNVPKKEPVTTVRGLKPGGFGIGIARDKTDKIEYVRDGEYNLLSMTKRILKNGGDHGIQSK